MVYKYNKNKKKKRKRKKEKINNKFVGINII